MLIAVLCVTNLWVLLLRSGIPYEFDGTITDIEVGTEKLAGIDDVWIVTIGDRELHLDTELARDLGKRRAVEKSSWETTLEIEGRPDISLHPSRDFWGMVPTLAVLVAAIAWVGLRRRRSG